MPVLFLPVEMRALDGDRAAWDTLIRQHERAVRLTLIARGHAPDIARELMQAAWTKLL